MRNKFILSAIFYIAISVFFFGIAEAQQNAVQLNDRGDYWSIITFDGGLNNKQNPLDIADNEAVFMNNYDIKDGYLYKRKGSVFLSQLKYSTLHYFYPSLLESVPVNNSLNGLLYHNKDKTVYFNDISCTPTFNFKSSGMGGYEIINTDPFSDLQILSYNNNLWFMEGNGLPPMRWNRKTMLDWASPPAPYIASAPGETGCTGIFRYAYSQLRGNTSPYEYPVSDWSDPIALVNGGADLTFTAQPGLHITNRKIYRSNSLGDTIYHYLVSTITNTEPAFIVIDNTIPIYPPSGTDPAYGAVYDAQTPRGKYTTIHYNMAAVAGILGLSSCVWFSEPGDFHSFPQSYRLFIDSDDGDIITAIYVFQGNLIALKKHHFYKVVGTSRNTFQYLLMSDNIGCVDAKSVKIVNDVLVWAAEDGIYGYDGNVIKKLSSKIDTLYKQLIRPKINFKTAIIDTYDDWNEGDKGDTSVNIDIKTYPGFLVMTDIQNETDNYISKEIYLSDKIKQWGAITVAMSFARQDSPVYTIKWQPYAPKIYYRADTLSCVGKAWKEILFSTATGASKYCYNLNFAADYGGLGLPTNYKYIQFKVQGNDARDTTFPKETVVDNIAVEWLEYSGGNLPNENGVARDTVCVPSMTAEVWDNHYWLSADIDTGALISGSDTAYLRKVVIKMDDKFRFTTYYSIDEVSKTLMTPMTFTRYGEYFIAGYGGRRPAVFMLEADTSLTRNSWSDSVGLYYVGGYNSNTYAIQSLYRTKNFDFGFPVWQKNFKFITYTLDVAEINNSETMNIFIKYKVDMDTVWRTLQDTFPTGKYGHGSINRKLNFPHSINGITIQFEIYDNSNRAYKLQRLDVVWNKNLDIFNRRE